MEISMGFMENRSCQANLIKINSDVIDFCKAFDLVLH